MTEKATVTFPDGRTATVEGPDRDAVQLEVQRLEAQYHEASQTREDLPKMGRVPAAINLLTQGATFGWSDEIGAAAEAMVKAPFSDKSWGDIYSEQHATEQDNIARSREAFPVQSMTSEVLGGILTGGAIGRLAGRGATELLARFPGWAKLAGLGAAGGAVYGAGTADEGGRLVGAAQGAGIGAVASPIGGAVVSVGANAIRKIGQPIVRALNNAPRNQAERIIRNAVESGDLSEEFIREELERLGPQATLADVADSLQRLARGVAAHSGRGSSIASSFLRGRQQGQQQRLTGDLDVSDFKRTFEEFVTNRSTSATELYNQAYNTPLQMTNRLQILLTRPSIQKAMKKAESIIREEGGQSSHVRLFQAVKEELDDKIGAALRTGKNNVARRLLQTKRALLEEIDAQVPAYAEARSVFAGEAALRDAANMGRTMFNRRVNLDATEIALEAMEEGERAAFRMGALRGLVDKLESMADNRNAAGALINSPRSREILRRVFPSDESFDDFVRNAQAESRFTETRNTVLGGSPTSRIDADKAAVSEAASIGTAIASGGDPIATTVGVLRNMGMGDVSEETLEQVARMLFSRELPERTIERVVPQIRSQTPRIIKQGEVAGASNALWQGDTIQ